MDEVILSFTPQQCLDISFWVQSFISILANDRHSKYRLAAKERNLRAWHLFHGQKVWCFQTDMVMFVSLGTWGDGTNMGQSLADFKLSNCLSNSISFYITIWTFMISAKYLVFTFQLTFFLPSTLKWTYSKGKHALPCIIPFLQTVLTAQILQIWSDLYHKAE